MKRVRRCGGFTLVEVLVALAIVAVSLGAGFQAAASLVANADRLGEVSNGQWCADNYLTKPLDYEALSAVVERAMEKARLLEETSRLRDRLRERNAFGHIIGEHPSMRAIAVW